MIHLTEAVFSTTYASPYQRGGDAAMFAKGEVKAKERSDVMLLSAPVELDHEQLEEASGGCLYGHGIVGPTLILPVLVAVLIG